VCETHLVPNIQFDANGAARVRGSDLSRYGLSGRAVEIRHDDVRAFIGEAPSGGLSDAAPGADHDRDVAGE